MVTMVKTRAQVLLCVPVVCVYDNCCGHIYQLEFDMDYLPGTSCAEIQLCLVAVIYHHNSGVYHMSLVFD